MPLRSSAGSCYYRLVGNCSSSMAMTALSQNIIPKCQSPSLQNPNFVHYRAPVLVRFLSISKPESDEESSNNTSTQSSSSFSSRFSDVKETLTNQELNQQQTTQLLSRQQLPFSTQRPKPKIDFLEEIGKNLSGFRRRSTPESVQDSSSPQVSFSELYRKSVAAKADDASSQLDKGGKVSFDIIRDSFRQLRNSAAANAATKRKGLDPMSLSAFKESLLSRPGEGVVKPMFGSGRLPESVFGKEIAGNKDARVEGALRKTEFVRMYSHKELGEKLRKLRPDAKGGGWFSVEELNERLTRLRVMEESESESKIGGVPFGIVRESLRTLEEKAKKPIVPRVDVLSQLGQIGGMRNYMLAPPKAHLVDKYFHPDLMNASEKLKDELKRARDDFKMHESDCGSSQVQIAQLSVKIRYLSAVIPKKDKQSLRGLMFMVHGRKKLLKYLRRTDFDAYSMVISKLGLRDSVPKKRYV